MSMGPKAKLEFACPVGKEHFHPVEGGSMCDLCEKKVFDLRGKTDQEVNTLIASHGGEICGTVAENQLGNTPEEKLILQAGRPLKSWEIWLLALFFCFGGVSQAQGQTSSRADEKELASINETIDYFLADQQAQCTPGITYQGIMRLGPLPIEAFFDTVKVDFDSLDRGNKGREIIVLRPFLHFLPNNTTVYTYPYGGGAAESFGNLILSTDSIVDFPWKIVNIHGHADSTEEGDLDSLSLARAQAVADFLKRFDLPNEIRVKGFGATKPVEWPEDPQPYQNSRVEVILSEDWNY